MVSGRRWAPLRMEVSSGTLISLCIPGPLILGPQRDLGILRMYLWLSGRGHRTGLATSQLPRAGLSVAMVLSQAASPNT